MIQLQDTCILNITYYYAVWAVASDAKLRHMCTHVHTTKPRHL